MEVFRSTIRSELLALTLKRGSLLSGGGAFLLVIGGTIIPLEMLSLWGLPFFTIGMIFIALGLFPYRKLARLQLKPHELHLDGETLIFVQQGKPLFQLEKFCVAKISYLEKEHLYGIGIWLNHPLVEKVRVLQRNFNFSAFAADSMKRFEGCDLFLPFFSKQTFENLKGQLESGRAF